MLPLANLPHSPKRGSSPLAAEPNPDWQKVRSDQGADITDATLQHSLRLISVYLRPIYPFHNHFKLLISTAVELEQQWHCMQYVTSWLHTINMNLRHQGWCVLHLVMPFSVWKQTRYLHNLLFVSLLFVSSACVTSIRGTSVSSFFQPRFVFSQKGNSQSVRWHTGSDLQLSARRKNPQNIFTAKRFCIHRHPMLAPITIRISESLHKTTITELTCTRLYIN